MHRLIIVLGTLTLALFAPATHAQWSFNNCGATGPDGPSQGACDTEYNSTPLDGAVALSGGIQTWTVPATGTYRIEVSGAAGGDSIEGSNGTFLGGSGATVAGDFHLVAGEQLSILVGQQGTTPPTEPSGDPLAGGGGGSFVWRVTGDELLIAAGGGGGAGDGYATTGGDGADGVATAAGSLPAGINPCASLAVAGEGWTTASYTCGGNHAGGGAGWNSNGVINAYDCDSTGTNALSPLNGGTGGDGNNDLEPETGPGGFGGGGGSATECGSTGGGGGGGYTGGAGLGCSAADACGSGGGGGGSFNSGANPMANDGVNSGHGLVLVTALSTARPVPALSQWGLLLLVLVLTGMVALRFRGKLLR